MPLLDIRTMAVVFVAGNLLVGLLMALAFRGRRDPALNTWIVSLFVQAAGWIWLPTCEARQAVTGFVLICISVSMMTSALAMYYRISQRYAWPYLPVILALLLLVLNPKTLLARQLAATGINILQLTLACVLVLSQRDRWFALRAIMAGSGLLTLAILLARMFQLMTAQGEVSCIAEPSLMQSVSFLIFFISRFSFIFGFMLLIEARQREEVTRLATLDSLTEVYNRRTFLELAERELLRCKRTGRSISLMILDLDHFKKVNDTYGHRAGDEVLRRVARVAGKCLRAHDVFARYGGEEFVVLVPETDQEGTRIVAERFRSLLMNSTPPGKPGITVSIGIASLYQVGESDTLDSLIASADAALYRAKDAGRNRVMEAVPLPLPAV